jgi:serine O-acetyltransferase
VNAKNAKMEKYVSQMLDTYEDEKGVNFIDVANLPMRDKILDALELLLEVLFPGYTGKRPVTKSSVGFVVGDILCQAHDGLVEQIERAYRHACRMKKCPDCDCRKIAQNVTDHLFNEMPNIRRMLESDVQAAYEGDPAAASLEEIVLSYPCMTAIATHRIAHELYKKEVPLIPRIMSECAHRLTGIDIHPGATIGRNFFIDHGTGVVIGETTIIGDNVRIYQGVTLGALSFRKDEQGRIVKGGKRHPTIEDDVIIYAEATILGDIVIGKGSVVGGNAWIKESIPPGTMVMMANPELVFRHNDHKKK